MTGWYCTVLAGCALAMMASSSSARADGGQIAFSGAVMAPTCSISAARGSAASHPSNIRSDTHRFACGSGGAAAGAGRAYALTEVDLDATIIANDRVLAYFAGYLSAAGVAEAKLVTQTFE